MNGTLFFSADDGTNGNELWKSDGTAAGTVLVKDINPGSSSSYPGNLTNVNGTLFFAANDGTGHELWKSDGTAAGTVLVKDITRLPAASGLPRPPDERERDAVLQRQRRAHGDELWKSDGTAAGTVLVKDIDTAPDGFTTSSPFDLTK